MEILMCSSNLKAIGHLQGSHVVSLCLRFQTKQHLQQIDIHIHTCAYIYTYTHMGSYSYAVQCQQKCMWTVYVYFFIMVNVIVCLQVLLFELCKFKQKERNLHWMTVLSVSVLLCE